MMARNRQGPGTMAAGKKVVGKKLVSSSSSFCFRTDRTRTRNHLGSRRGYSPLPNPRNLEPFYGVYFVKLIKYMKIIEENLKK